jgi:hypothetical protein
LATAKLRTVQVTKLPLYHKTRKTGMTCFAKPRLTDDMCVVQKKDFSVNMLYMRYVHLTKAKPIHKRQTHPLVTEDVNKDYDRKGSVKKKKDLCS